MPKGNGTTFDYSDPVTNTLGHPTAAGYPGVVYMRNIYCLFIAQSVSR